MHKKTMATALAATVLLGACAPAPDQVSASYVSPSIFQGRSCSSLLTERNEIVSQVNTLTEEQRKASTNDAVATGVALVLFWPAAFAIASSKDQSTSLSAAKGNYDAITSQMRSKGCALPPEPEFVTASEEGPKKRSWE